MDSWGKKALRWLTENPGWHPTREIAIGAGFPEHYSGPRLKPYRSGGGTWGVLMVTDGIQFRRCECGRSYFWKAQEAEAACRSERGGE